MVLGSVILDETSDCKELVALLKAWNEATAEERHKLGVKIGKKAGELLTSKGKSSEDLREELARFLKSQIRKKK